MNGRLAFASMVGGALALLGAFASVPACQSEEVVPDDGGPVADATYIDAPTFCDFFTEAGAPCPGVSKTACFPMCATGGCFCSATPDGPRWTCTTDFSCVPEAGPLDDSGVHVTEGDADVGDAGSAIDAADATVGDAADGSSAADAGDGATGDAAATDAADSATD